ncbi:hypothetical protein F2P81_003882 [Scophthalmus maximus]|uniref:Tyr recombinase domain-containing protein n=1 Tax=Scophthalmus maximus TaxID=52904 RepID=A0A6A4TNA3_SCOMX|nr:hypothetical protein F2P81_003882 [Scophthalmus maximus]
MKGWYDRKAESRDFTPVDKVLVLLTIPSCSLQARFSGPYLVKKKDAGNCSSRSSNGSAILPTCRCSFSSSEESNPCRCGEYTTSSDSFDPLNDLTISDITVDSDMYSIHIKHFKTDREGKGPTVVISQTNTAFCPLSSMNLYLQRQPHVRQDQLFFLTDKGKAMSRSWFTTRLCLLRQRCGLPPQLYTSHSLRIGAAISAAALVPTSTLKAMGHWSSSAYKRYIRPGVNEIISAQKTMSANT